MFIFKDANGVNVRLSFKRGAFSKAPQHVLVICQDGGSWLLTKHKKRGLEFPGGKVEKGESLEEAAHREVFEETGARLKALKYIGEYEVGEGDKSFVKAIFYGLVDKIESRENYFETKGPVLVDGDILQLRKGKDFSFLMKDSVIEKSLEYIKKHC